MCKIPIEPGLMVQIDDPSVKRGSWRHGLIHEVHPSRDNLIRTVTVKTIGANGKPSFLKRSVQRLSYFEHSLLETAPS